MLLESTDAMMTMKIMRELSVYTIMIHFASTTRFATQCRQARQLSSCRKTEEVLFYNGHLWSKGYETMSKKAADIIAAQLILKPTAVLGLGYRLYSGRYLSKSDQKI